MKFTDETLMAYADGELEADARAAVEAAIAGDPALAAQVAKYRAQRELLTRSYAPMLDEPVPARLLRILEAGSQRDRTIVDLQSRRSARDTRQRIGQWSWPEWAALAASLVLGVLLSRVVSLDTGQSPITGDARGLVARRSLASALSTQLASSQSPTAAVQIGVTFENTTGQLCRTFTTHLQRPLSGLACFDAGEWRVAMTIVGREPDIASAADGMRKAGTDLPPALLRAVTDQIRGEPLDADAERAARAAGWQR
jgi:anti-sigma-K factor RskA